MDIIVRVEDIIEDIHYLMVYLRFIGHFLGVKLEKFVETMIIMKFLVKTRTYIKNV